MKRIILHWNAGGNRASALDRKHYRRIMEIDRPIMTSWRATSANAKPIRIPCCSIRDGVVASDDAHKSASETSSAATNQYFLQTI